MSNAQLYKPIPSLEVRAQMLAASKVTGDGLGNGAVRFIMMSRAVINELLYALRSSQALSVADEEDTLP